LLAVIQILREYVTFQVEEDAFQLEEQDRISELEKMENLQDYVEFSDRLREKLIADASSASLEVTLPLITINIFRSKLWPL
jgi:hypothetical protein